MSRVADFRSDTVTRPTARMIEAMAAAHVGDDVLGDDPTVMRLEATFAALFGKEAAIFLPSGTMGNQCAVAAHIVPGEEVIVEANSHIFKYEGGALARIAGAHVNMIQGERGMFPLPDLARAFRAPSVHFPRTGLVCVEQTHLMSGGCIVPMEYLEEVKDMAAHHGVPVHMDGARLLNAVVESGIPATDFAAACDSCWIDLSKGLGCPVGAVLAGSADFIAQAWTWKQRLGGAMRQAGILAAAGLYALDHHVARLAEDHANARRLSELLAGATGLRQDDAEVATNMVFFDISALGVPASRFAELLAARGVEIVPVGPSRLRAVTHLDVGVAEIEVAAAAIRSLAAELAGG